MNDLLSASAVEIAQAIRQGDVSATEVVELHLGRIEEVNPRLNAIVTLCEQEARGAAAAADRATAHGPLHGVPFVVKDAIATAGIRSTAGSRLLERFVPVRDGTAVARLKQAGAILIGKTNCPEFALDPHTDNRIFGPTLNPLDPTLSPGGSSGGDAAAVAAGCAAFGLGADYGASVRWPAQCTGIVGLRPTVGLVPLTGLLPYRPGEDLSPPSSISPMSRLHTFGPLARSVEDTWAVLSAIAGPDRIDPNTVPVPLGNPSAVDVSSIAVAWMDGEGNQSVRPDLVAVVAGAASRLESLGLRVEEHRPPGLEQAIDLFRAYRLADALPVHAELARGREDELADTMRNWFERVRPAVPFGELQSVAARRDTVRAQVLEFMERWPIMLLPVSLAPAWRIGSADFAQRFHDMAPCWAITLLGLPSLAITCGRTEDGLPAAVQIVGRPFSDHEVIAVGVALGRTIEPSS